MRSFSKKLAFVLAAAMVFTSFAPAAKAEAAKEMTINKSSQILYVTDGNGINDAAQVGGGKGNVSEYDFYVKNKPSDWKKTLKFEWSSSNEDVATVNQSGLTTAVAVGKATISCKITEKDGDVVATSKVKVTVKANAADVEIKNASKISGTVLELKDGKATLDLDRVMYDADGNKTTKRGTLVTDYTEWMYEPKTGVDVNQSKGVFTFTAPGEYKLYCRTYQSSKYTKTTAESDPVVVTVVDKSFELKQNTLTKFDINFNSAANVTQNDVAVDRVGTGADGKAYSYDVLVKSVIMSKDKMTATVETYLPLEGDATYEVAVKGYDTVSMVASDGDVVDVKVGVKDSVSYSVNIGKKDFLQYSLIDGNKVDVSRGTTDEKNKVVFNIKYYGKNGTNYELAYYALNAGLFEFNEAGDKAVITVTYNTGKLDASNNLITVTSEPTTFYAVAKQDVTVTGITGYATKAITNEQWYNYWSADKGLVKDTKNTTLKYTVSLADGSTQDILNQNQYIYDKEGVQHGWLYVESVDEDVVDIQEGTGNLVVSPRKEGSALLMVYHKTRLSDGTILTSPVGTLPLTVKGKPVLTDISLDWGGNTKTTTLSIDAANDDLEKAKYGVRTLDQYGVGINPARWELTGATQEAEAIRTAGGITFAGGEIKIDSAKFRTAIMNQTSNMVSNGQYIYTLKFQCGVSWAWKSATIVVDIRGLAKDANNVVVKNEAVDCAWFNSNIARIADGQNNGTKAAAFKVYFMNNGAKYDNIALSKFDSSINISTATPGYYFKVYKNGADITYKVNGTDIVFDNNNGVTLVFSKTKNYGGHTIVNYDDMGAGAYDLVVYYIGQSPYYGSTNTTITPVQISTEVARMQKVVTCDAGAYTLVSRDSVNIAGGANSYLDILRCFTFKNRGGDTLDKYNNATTASAAKFGNNVVTYYVETDPLLTTADSVYVKSITFFEKVENAVDDDQSTTDVDESKPAVYAAYKVPIGYYINTNVPQ